MEGSRGLVVGVDVFYAGFVEGDVGFSEREEVRGEGLVFGAGGCVERGGESCERAVDWGATASEF